MATLTICRDTNLNKQRYSTCTLAFVFTWGIKEPLQICRPLNVFIFDFFMSVVIIIKDSVCHKNGLFAPSLSEASDFLHPLANSPVSGRLPWENSDQIRFFDHTFAIIWTHESAPVSSECCRPR